MEEDTQAKVHNIVSHILQNPEFKNMLSGAVAHFTVHGQLDVVAPTTNPQPTLLNDVSANRSGFPIAPSPSIPSTSLGHYSSSPSLVQNLRSLFPSTRGKVPVFSKLKKKKNSWSTTFYRDIILLKDARAVMTLKGLKKTEAFNKGLGLADVKLDCKWNRQEIFNYMYELFSAHLSQEDKFDIFVPESGRLMKIDDSREELDGYKLKRIFHNRKPVYLRISSLLPNSPLATSQHEDFPPVYDGFNELYEPLDTQTNSDEVDFQSNCSTVGTVTVLHSTEELSYEEGNERFERDINIALERSLTDGEVTIESLLSQFSNRINRTHLNPFNIYRKEVFSSCIRAISRKKFAPFGKIDVTFSDRVNVTEGAVDAGGPKREMFRLLLKELRSCSLFEGCEKKYVSLNSKSLENNEYFHAGRLIALAVVHIGQGPGFFSDVLFSVIVNGINDTKPDEEYIEQDTLQSIYKIRNVNSLNELQDIVVNDPVFTFAGIYFISNLEEREAVIQRAIKYYNFYRVKAAIDQFVDGLKTCDVYEAMLKHPNLFYPLMCTPPPPLTSKVILNLFKVNYSDEGSNCREAENKVIAFWRDYALDSEEIEDEDSGVTLEEILIFATGSSNIPLLGFDVEPSIQFLHVYQSDNNTGLKRLPEANTCILRLYLPVGHNNYDNFKSDMDYGIKNGKVFGKV